MSIARLAILGALMERPMHGYDLRKYLEHAQGVFWMINYGSIYPTLKKMDKEGLVKGKLESSDTARSKITYSITEEGQKRFLETLGERLNKEAFVRDEFTLHLFFMDHLDKKVIKEALEKKIKGNTSVLEMIKIHDNKCKEELSGFRYEVLRRGKMHVETELSWLKSVIENMEV